MIRFIAVCIGVTFIFILAIPVIQVGTLISTNDNATLASADIELNDEIGTDTDPFEVFAENEPSAEDLNEMAPAAGGDINPNNNADFGEFFYQENQQSFEDQNISEDRSEAEITDIDL